MSDPARDLTVGTVLSETRTITGTDIEQAARITGDFGAHHIVGVSDLSGSGDKPIAQGLLTLCVAPLVRGDRGFHQKELDVDFLAPVYAGETLTGRTRIESVTSVFGGIEVGISVDVTNQDDVRVLTCTGTLTDAI